MTDDREPELRLDDVRTICRDVRSTLGPFGTNKLLVEENGTVTVTSTAAVFLDRLDVSKPGVRLLETAASEFRDRNGDGSGAVVALTGALLEEADRLRGLGVHPTTIDRGFRDGLDVAIETTTEQTTPPDDADVNAVANTALTAVRDPAVRRQVGQFVTSAVDRIERQSGEVNPADVGVVARLGAAHSETDLVSGVVVDDDPVATGMPRHLSEAGIAVLSASVDVDALGTTTGRRGDVEVTLETESFEDRKALADAERESFRATLREAVNAGCNCLVTGESINDRVKTVLANEGVLALHQLDEREVARIARATGAEAVPDLTTVSAETLGRGEITVTRKAGRDMTVVESEDADVYTLFCRAPDPRSVEAFERSVESAVAAVTSARRTGVVPGGGAVETEIARRVRSQARSRRGREQLAMDAFADAVEVIPRALARNAGLDDVDAVSDLRARHDDGEATVGVEASVGELVDIVGEASLLEPAVLKERTLEGATEIAVQLIRIDDVLPAGEASDEEMPDALGDVSVDRLVED